MTLRAVVTLAVVGAVCVFGAVGVALAVDGSDRSTLFATLNGANEVSADTSKKGAGDPDGAGGFNGTVDGNQLCYGISVANLDAPVAAHIHLGNPSEAGPVVVPLSPPATGDPGAVGACVTVAADLAAALAANPTAYYVNVHTGTFPGGAVRGQLFKG